jgi:hypothetical protein
VSVNLVSVLQMIHEVGPNVWPELAGKVRGGS